MFLNTVFLLLLTVGSCQAGVRIVLCFSGNNSVETLSRGSVSIDSLIPGDYVKTYDHRKGYIYSRFVDYLHFEPAIKAEFLRVTASTGPYSRTHIEISKLHLIQRLKVDQPESYHDFEYVFAGDLKVDDYIYIAPDSDVIQEEVDGDYFSDDNVLMLGKVTAIEAISQYGAYAPLTDHGTVLVSNALASCYANVYSHTVAHYILKPVRMVSNFVGQNYELDSNSESIYQREAKSQNLYINPFALMLLEAVQKTSLLS